MCRFSYILYVYQPRLQTQGCEKWYSAIIFKTRLRQYIHKDILIAHDTSDKTVILTYYSTPG